MEIQKYPGKCGCGKLLDIKTTDDEDKECVWFVHAYCKKCDVVFILGIFWKFAPVHGRDFIIDYDDVIVKKLTITAEVG